VSNALPFTKHGAPSVAPVSAPITQTLPKIPRTVTTFDPLPLPLPPPPIQRTTHERMLAAKERIRMAAEAGERIRSYEVALEVDLSEFHFARQFRAAFGRSPHVFYDEIRAAKARKLLAENMATSDVARLVGLRRPAELRLLLTKR